MNDWTGQCCGDFDNFFELPKPDNKNSFIINQTIFIRVEGKVFGGTLWSMLNRIDLEHNKYNYPRKKQQFQNK